MRVLLIHETLPISLAISHALTRDCKAVVDSINTGEEALEMMRHYDYDAVVLDLRLPDMDGYDVLRRMRAAQRVMPVLVLSPDRFVEGRIRACGLGADDVVTKPFDMDELVARVQAIIRRSKGHSQSTVQIGSVHLNLDSHLVTVEGRPVSLTRKEYSILELLMMRRGMVLTKEAFLNHLYGGLDEPEPKIIDVFICKLRKKLALAGAANVIATAWGRGYMVRQLEAAAFTVASAATSQSRNGGREQIMPGAFHPDDGDRAGALAAPMLASA